MSNNVFGTPVTDGSRVERATAALNNPNTDGKRNQAIDYVRRQKQLFGNGVSTLCIFYNATGETLLLAEHNSSYGGIYDAYPTRVQNGQWGAFLHTKSPVVASGSVGYVVYRGRNTDVDFCKQLFAWQTPWGQLRYNNLAYCDVFEDAAVINPNDVYKAMEDNNARQHTVMKLGMFITTILEEGTSPLYEAELTIDSAVKKKSEEDVEPSSS